MAARGVETLTTLIATFGFLNIFITPADGKFTEYHLYIIHSFSSIKKSNIYEHINSRFLWIQKLPIYPGLPTDEENYVVVNKPGTLTSDFKYFISTKPTL